MYDNHKLTKKKLIKDNLKNFNLGEMFSWQTVSRQLKCYLSNFQNFIFAISKILSLQFPKFYLCNFQNVILANLNYAKACKAKCFGRITENSIKSIPVENILRE